MSSAAINSPIGAEAATDIMSRNALVTVGLGVYNGERWVAETIDSILKQSFQNFVLLISDNCSTDATFDICRRYAAIDPRVWLVQPPRNVGAAENFNRMCRMAVGKYFKYASCGDTCAPDFLLRCVEVLERHDDVVVCCPKVALVDDETGVAEAYPHGLHLMQERPLERLKAFHGSLHLNNAEQGLIRLSVLRKTRLQGAYVGSDVNFMAELALRGKFYEVPEPLFFRRHGRRSTSVRRSKAELASFYSPGAKLLLWQTWKHMIGYSSIAFRVRLDPRERLALMMHIAKKWRYAAHDLRADIVQAVRYALVRTKRMA